VSLLVFLTTLYLFSFFTVLSYLIFRYHYTIYNIYIYIFSSNSVHVRLRVYRLYDSQICWVAPVGNEGCPGAHCYWEGEHPNIHDICS